MKNGKRPDAAPEAAPDTAQPSNDSKDSKNSNDPDDVLHATKKYVWCSSVVKEDKVSAFYDSMSIRLPGQAAFRVYVGDTVLFQSEDSVPFIGAVDALYENKSTKRCSVKARWFFRSNDVKLALPSALDGYHSISKSEVFYSSYVDDNDVQSILRPCTMIYLSVDEPTIPIERGNKDTFLCRCRFDAKHGISALKQSEIISLSQLPQLKREDILDGQRGAVKKSTAAAIAAAATAATVSTSSTSEAASASATASQPSQASTSRSGKKHQRSTSFGGEYDGDHDANTLFDEDLELMTRPVKEEKAKPKKKDRASTGSAAASVATSAATSAATSVAASATATIDSDSHGGKGHEETIVTKVPEAPEPPGSNPSVSSRKRSSKSIDPTEEDHQQKRSKASTSTATATSSSTASAGDAAVVSKKPRSSLAASAKAAALPSTSLTVTEESAEAVPTSTPAPSSATSSAIAATDLSSAKAVVASIAVSASTDDNIAAHNSDDEKDDDKDGDQDGEEEKRIRNEKKISRKERDRLRRNAKKARESTASNKSSGHDDDMISLSLSSSSTRTAAAEDDVKVNTIATAAASEIGTTTATDTDTDMPAADQTGPDESATATTDVDSSESLTADSSKYDGASASDETMAIAYSLMRSTVNDNKLSKLSRSKGRDEVQLKIVRELWESLPSSQKIEFVRQAVEIRVEQEQSRDRSRGRGHSKSFDSATRDSDLMDLRPDVERPGVELREAGDAAEPSSSNSSNSNSSSSRSVGSNRSTGSSSTSRRQSSVTKLPKDNQSMTESDEQPASHPSASIEGDHGPDLDPSFQAVKRTKGRPRGSSSRQGQNGKLVPHGDSTTDADAAVVDADDDATGRVNGDGSRKAFLSPSSSRRLLAQDRRRGDDDHHDHDHHLQDDRGNYEHTNEEDNDDSVNSNDDDDNGTVTGRRRSKSLSRAATKAAARENRELDGTAEDKSDAAPRYITRGNAVDSFFHSLETDKDESLHFLSHRDQVKHTRVDAVKYQVDQSSFPAYRDSAGLSAAERSTAVSARSCVWSETAVGRLRQNVYEEYLVQAHCRLQAAKRLHFSGKSLVSKEAAAAVAGEKSRADSSVVPVIDGSFILTVFDVDERLLAILHERNYQVQEAMNEIDNHIDELLVCWKLEEQQDLNAAFLRDGDNVPSLMAAVPEKSRREVIDYYLRCIESAAHLQEVDLKGIHRRKVHYSNKYCDGDQQYRCAEADDNESDDGDDGGHDGGHHEAEGEESESADADHAIADEAITDQGREEATSLKEAAQDDDYHDIEKEGVNGHDNEEDASEEGLRTRPDEGDHDAADERSMAVILPLSVGSSDQRANMLASTSDNVDAKVAADVDADAAAVSAARESLVVQGEEAEPEDSSRVENNHHHQQQQLEPPASASIPTDKVEGTTESAGAMDADVADAMVEAGVEVEAEAEAETLIAADSTAAAEVAVEAPVKRRSYKRYRLPNSSLVLDPSEESRQGRLRQRRQEPEAAPEMEATRTALQYLIQMQFELDPSPLLDLFNALLCYHKQVLSPAELIVRVKMIDGQSKLATRGSSIERYIFSQFAKFLPAPLQDYLSSA